MPFRPRVVKTTPVAVAHIPDTARRARAYSVGQKRVGVWSGHIVHRDDREALCLFVHDRSSQDPFVRAPFVSIRLSSLVRPFSCSMTPFVRLVEAAWRTVSNTLATRMPCNFETTM